MPRDKFDLKTLLALYQQFSPEAKARQQMDEHRLREMQSAEAYAQERGFPTFSTMKFQEAENDRAQRTELWNEGRQQANLTNDLNLAYMAGKPDLALELLKKTKPEWFPAAPTPQQPTR